MNTFLTNLVADLTDWNLWKMIIAAVIYVVGTHFNLPILETLAIALGFHGVATQVALTARRP